MNIKNIIYLVNIIFTERYFQCLVQYKNRRNILFFLGGIGKDFVKIA